MFQRSVTARACTLLVATLVLVPLACAQGGGAGDGGDKESICDEQQKQLVSFCYSKKSMEKCQDPEADHPALTKMALRSSPGIHWLPVLRSLMSLPSKAAE